MNSYNKTEHADLKKDDTIIYKGSDGELLKGYIRDVKTEKGIVIDKIVKDTQGNPMKFKGTIDSTTVRVQNKYGIEEIEESQMWRLKK
jgi:hypothetical protein